MQQKLCSRGTSCSFFPEDREETCGGGGASGTSSVLPFRCPRCGENQRFRSLASLRAHLEYRHSYHRASSYELSLPLPASRGQQQPHRVLHVRSLSDTRGDAAGVVGGFERRRTQSVGTQADQGAQTEEEEEEEDEEDEEEEEEDEEDSQPKSIRFTSSACPDRPIPFPPPFEPPPGPDLGGGRPTPPQTQTPVCGDVAVRRRLAGALRGAAAADSSSSSMQSRLARVSTALAHTDTQLLSERAHGQHLARETRGALARERALSRQVDVAVAVIAALREQLDASEDELERREQEVLTIQNFLEAAAQQEMCGKVRIQHFIESLLQRISLAERLLEYYQSSPSPAYSSPPNSSPPNRSPPNRSHYMHHQTVETGPHRMSKSRSAGGQLSASCPQEGRLNSAQLGRPFPRPTRDRLVQSSGHCRPERSRDQLWNQHRRSAGHEA